MNQPTTPPAAQSIRLCGTPLLTTATDPKSDGLQFVLYVDAELKTKQDADKLIARIAVNREFLTEPPAQTVGPAHD